TSSSPCSASSRTSGSICQPQASREGDGSSERTTRRRTSHQLNRPVALRRSRQRAEDQSLGAAIASAIATTDQAREPPYAVERGEAWPFRPFPPQARRRCPP